MNFTHLHVHTEYSLLDGAARIKDLVSKAADLSMSAVAITDHGVMFGVIDFYKECKKKGIKPVLGCEIYTAARKHTDKDPVLDKGQAHLILLAENETGYKNLMKIVSTGFVEGFYYKPRVDYDVLRRHSEGLIALSACLAGKVQQKLLIGDYEGAKAEAYELQDIFGKDNFFLEIQNQGLEEEARIIPLQKKLSQETGIPLVATNDVHYVNREDAKAQEILLCIQTGKTVNDADRMRFESEEFYFKSQDEMERLFADIPEALEMTNIIADRCNVEIEFNNYHLPGFDQPPEFESTTAYLRYLCNKGLEERYGEDAEKHRERLEYELSTIENMGYVEYFLIVWDFINYARENSIMVGPGRGSAAGSVAAYCLHITDIDPIRYNLIFERFLNPERVSMPDIDVDFCYERRQEVIDYVIRKYGKDRVSQIITFGTLKAKAVIRDVGRVLNISYGETDEIAKMIPADLHMTIDTALKVNPDLKKKYDEVPYIRELIDMGRALEGMPRHSSTHAAGVVISNLPVDEYVPLYNSDKGISTQFTMGTIEELGLLKMDFLGLRNLTVIRDAIDMIWENHGIRVDFSTMEYDDPAVYRLISSGNTLGVFQLESGGMTAFMKNLKPDCIEDIVAGVALYRPGPMDSIPKYIENKKNPEKISYVDPSLAPILDVTYGCLVYQEQVMQIVRDLGGYTYGRSDLVRRAMSKKKMEVMEEERECFINGKTGPDGEVEVQGCVRNGVSKEAANVIFDDMVKFAEYAFNKSHAAAYAVLAYETAWLKTYYPHEFMAALMTSVMGDAKNIAKYIRNCGDLGITVLPPDINLSSKKFAVSDRKIRFALSAIKNVGEGFIDEILRVRKKHGNFRDFFDFIESVDIHKVNKKAVESMIRAGAFDSLGNNRAQLMSVYESVIESAQSSAKKNVAGQMSLFSDFGDSGINESLGSGRLPAVGEFPRDVLLSMEKEVTGLYLSGHPLDDLRPRIERIISHTSEDIAGNEENNSLKDGTRVVIAGLVNHMRTLITKAGRRMGFVTVEDFCGTIEVIVFPNVFDEVSSKLSSDECLVVSGRISLKEEEEPKVIAESVMLLNEEESLNPGQRWRGGARESGTKRPQNDNKGVKSAEERLFILIPADADEGMAFGEIKSILTRHPGNVSVIIKSGKTGRKFRADASMNVDGSDLLKRKLGACGYL